jgi:hypothetical protein
MKEVDILQRLIKEEGSCDGWAESMDACASCPLAKFKTKPDGNYLSCIEAVGISEDMSEHEMNTKYKAAAEKVLVDLQMEAMLEEDSGTK